MKRKCGGKKTCGLELRCSSTSFSSALFHLASLFFFKSKERISSRGVLVVQLVGSQGEQMLLGTTHRGQCPEPPAASKNTLRLPGAISNAYKEPGAASREQNLPPLSKLGAVQDFSEHPRGYMPPVVMQNCSQVAALCHYNPSPPPTGTACSCMKKLRMSFFA